VGQDDRTPRRRNLTAVRVAGHEGVESKRGQATQAVGAVTEDYPEGLAVELRGGHSSITVAGPGVVEADDGNVRPRLWERYDLVHKDPGTGTRQRLDDGIVMSPQVVIPEHRQLDRAPNGCDKGLECRQAPRFGLEEDVVTTEKQDIGLLSSNGVEGGFE
jgi:hypothetical protein